LRERLAAFDFGNINRFFCRLAGKKRKILLLTVFNYSEPLSFENLRDFQKSKQKFLKLGKKPKKLKSGGFIKP